MSLPSIAALPGRAARASLIVNFSVVPSHVALPGAASLLWLRRAAPQLGRVERPEKWEPLYVRDWKIEEENG